MVKSWCLALLVKLKNVHCVLEFNQSQWLKVYVEVNKQKIIDAKKKRKWWQRWKRVVQVNEK